MVTCSQETSKRGFSQIYRFDKVSDWVDGCLVDWVGGRVVFVEINDQLGLMNNGVR